MSGPNYSSRRSKLVRKFKSADIDALLISGEANVRYLTGFTGDSTWLFVSKAKTNQVRIPRYSAIYILVFVVIFGGMLW